MSSRRTAGQGPPSLKGRRSPLPEGAAGRPGPMPSTSIAAPARATCPGRIPRPGPDWAARGCARTSGSRSAAARPRPRRWRPRPLSSSARCCWPCPGRPPHRPPPGPGRPGGRAAGRPFRLDAAQAGPDLGSLSGRFRRGLGLLGTVTSVLVEPRRRVITLKDPALFESPLVILAGARPRPSSTPRTRGACAPISRRAGCSGSRTPRPAGGFLRPLGARRPQVRLPEAELAPLPGDHVVYRTFFLLRGAAAGSWCAARWKGCPGRTHGRGLFPQRPAGAWAKDALGRPLLPCVPGERPSATTPASSLSTSSCTP